MKVVVTSPIMLQRLKELKARRQNATYCPTCGHRTLAKTKAKEGKR